MIELTLTHIPKAGVWPDFWGVNYFFTAALLLVNISLMGEIYCLRKKDTQKYKATLWRFRFAPAALAIVIFIMELVPFGAFLMNVSITVFYLLVYSYVWIALKDIGFIVGSIIILILEAALFGLVAAEFHLYLLFIIVISLSLFSLFVPDEAA